MSAVSRRDLIRPWRLFREPPGFVRPPGAGPYFESRCERCTACFEVCPEQAIVPLADGTPAIFPRDKACSLCEGLLCTTVCEAGALAPTPMAEIRMGIATIDAATCWAKKGQPCDYCEVACPIDAISGAEIDPDVCVGCGLCVYICTATPAAVQLKSYA